MRYIIATFGCKVNQYESEAMELILKARGHVPAAKGEADCILVNSCAVTAEGERKVRQTVRRLKKENPAAVICFSGCSGQIDPDAAAALGAEVIYGTSDRMAFLRDAEAAVERHISVRHVPDTRERRPFELLPAGAYAGHARAYLKIEDGCDNFCSYCVIPYARGRVRSLGVEDCARQYAELAAQGYNEIVLTGIEIASYGKDLEGVTLIDAMEAMGKAAPEVRMHLGSLEPRIITEEFTERLKKLNVCPHFHLSLQSGCDETLRRMHRHYDTALFLGVVERLRAAFPGCGVTTDLICGFPGETEEEFSATMAFIGRCAFSDMHIFPYSVRPGTLAARMEGQLTAKVKNERCARAIALAADMTRRYAEGCVGTETQVIFETEKDGVSSGHSETYMEVAVEGSGLRGGMRRVRITGTDGSLLHGELI